MFHMIEPELSEPSGDIDPQSEPEPVVRMKLAFEINGWEQLRIADLFHRTLQQFEEDLVLTSRIALFVDALRKGVAEGEAFQKAMVITAAEVLERVQLFDAVDEGGVPLDRTIPAT